MLRWWRYLQGKGSLSHPSDDQTQTLPQIYWEALEQKAGWSMRLAPHISSSGSLQRTPQETLSVLPRLLFCSCKLLRLSSQESSLHPIDFSPKPFLCLFSEKFEFFWKFWRCMERFIVIGLFCCWLMIEIRMAHASIYIERPVKLMYWKVSGTNLWSLKRWDRLEQSVSHGSVYVAICPLG